MASQVLPAGYIQLNDAFSEFLEVFAYANGYVPQSPGPATPEWAAWYESYQEAYGKAERQFQQCLFDGAIEDYVLAHSPHDGWRELRLPRSYWQLRDDGSTGMPGLSHATGTVVGWCFDYDERGQVEDKPIVFRAPEWQRWIGRLRRRSLERSADVANAQTASHWSVGQAVVWIVTRNIADVARIGGDASGEDWIPPNVTDRSIVEISHRFIMEQVYDKGDKTDAHYLPAITASRMLVSELGRGGLTAYGLFEGAGSTTQIPSDAWAHLEIRDHRQLGIIAARPTGLVAGDGWWSDLRFRQSEVRSVWPVPSIPTGEPRGGPQCPAAPVSLRRAVELVCTAGSLDQHNACRALRRAFSLGLLVASGWIRPQVGAAVVYPELPRGPKAPVPLRVWSGEWTISWSDSKLIREPTPPGEPDEYREVEVDETRLHSWIQDHLLWGRGEAMSSVQPEAATLGARPPVTSPAKAPAPQRLEDGAAVERILAMMQTHEAKSVRDAVLKLGKAVPGNGNLESTVRRMQHRVREARRRL